MGAKLHIQPTVTEPFEVTIGNTATIGRTRENSVCLNFSPLVSRQHAIVRCHNGWQYQLIDLGSRNGTYVNDQRVVLPVTLAPGARIKIADNVLTFLEEDAPACDEYLQATLVGTMHTNPLEARPVALLVCDIRGFSTMSEKVPSANLAQVLGVWFREAGNLVQRSGGTIDKFIGDALLAYWGSGDPAENCTAAFEVARGLMALAAERTWPNGDAFQLAVAVHHGRVTCSNVGLAAERDATIIGDAVNTVFRLEVVSKELKRALVASGDLVEHLADQAGLVDCGEQSLKGKAQTVRVFGADS